MGWAQEAWSLEKYASEITRRSIFSPTLIISIGLEAFICISYRNMKASHQRKSMKTHFCEVIFFTAVTIG